MYSFLTKFSTNCYPGTRDSNLSLLALCFGFPSISQSSFFSYFFQLISLRYEYEAERMGISWPMLFFSLQKGESFSCFQVTRKNSFPWLGSGTHWWYIIFFLRQWESIHWFDFVFYYLAFIFNFSQCCQALQRAFTRLILALIQITLV